MHKSFLYVLAPVVGALLLSIGFSVTATPNEAANSYGLEEVQWVWLKADLNADGMLTREEVWEENAALVAKFDDADHDGNGTLNAGEFEILLMTS
ncbi:MAG TPA: hypothetical protein VEW72_10045 [Burkholderiales bacterium]|nr:hypothetical protein [Burkholderiales bacterium]